MLFFDRVMQPTVVIVEQEDGTKKELFAFRDNHGFILTKEQIVAENNDLMSVLKKSIEFYNGEGTGEWIADTNKKTSIGSYSSMNFDIDFQKNENGQFMIPDPKIDYKEFRSDLKSDWAFKCGWCGKKVSSKIDKNYYSVNFPSIPGLDHKPFERGCSRECATRIWNDVFKNWIYENEYQKYFKLM